jgi:hypothetical protein
MPAVYPPELPFTPETRATLIADTTDCLAAVSPQHSDSAEILSAVRAMWLLQQNPEPPPEPPPEP